MKHNASDIARWAEARAAAADTPRPLSRVEKSQIVVTSRRAGMTVPQLASEFARSEAEIVRVLREWVDTRAVAKHLITVQAADLADRMIAEADPAIALDILERVDVVRSKRGGGDNGRFTLILNGITLAGVPVPADDVVDGDVVPGLPALEGEG